MLLHSIKCNAVRRKPDTINTKSAADNGRFVSKATQYKKEEHPNEEEETHCNGPLRIHAGRTAGRLRQHQREHRIPDAAGNTGSASGGGWPSGPVSIVVPASAGGGTDLLARVLAEKLTAKLGQSFVVVNVTGAGGSSGINQVHEAAPDGNTILFFHNALLINNVTGVSDYSYEGLRCGPHVVTDNATGFYVSADAPTAPIRS